LAETEPEKRFQTFEQFWPFYLGEHSLPATRWLHFAGSTIALLQFVTLVATLRFWMLPAVLISGYGFAWFAHFFVEKNRPATFKHPLWSFIGDWKMWGLMLTGRLQSQLDRYGVVPKLPKTAARA